MVKSKIISLLKTFSKEEMKEFEKFIASPLFNKGRNYLPLYKALKPFYPQFSSPSLSEEYIYKKLYPKEKFDKKKTSTLRSMISRMSEMAEKFLAISEFNDNKAIYNSLLLNKLKKKNEVELFGVYSNKLKAGIENAVYGSGYFFSQYVLTQSICSYYHETNSNISKKSNEDISKIMESLILFLVSKLIWYDEAVSVFSSKYIPNSEIISKFNSCFAFDEFMNSLEESKLLNTDYLKMLYFSHKLVSDKKDADSYFKLKDLFLKHKNNLNYESKYEYIVKLMNFCLFQKLGERDYYTKEYLELNEIWINESEKGKNGEVFGIRSIRNVIRMTIRLGLVSELEKYLSDYSKYFDKEIRKDCVNYALASIAFSKKLFEECLAITGKHSFRIPMMIKDMKILRLQSCYELEYYDLLYNEIDSYRHFLTDTTGLPADFIENDKRFLKYFNKLVRNSEKSDKEGADLLYTEIKNIKSDNVLIKWIGLKLLEKLKILKFTLYCIIVLF